MHFPYQKFTIFEASSIEEISRFKKQLMKLRVEKLVIFLTRSREGPCRVGKVLCIEIVQAPLCHPCQLLERQGGTGKRWANDLDIIAILSYLMLSSSISRISCYLKASCFRPKPLHKHQQPPVGKKVFFTIPPTEVIKNQTKFDQN